MAASWPLPLFADGAAVVGQQVETASYIDELRAFRWDGQRTREQTLVVGCGRHDLQLPMLTNEFWTSRQRAAHSLHEVSYRACFKPQLPRFFIERLTTAGGCVYDPFMGRGTTLVEAALLGRRPIGCDVNPLSRVLVEPRLDPPRWVELVERVGTVPFDQHVDVRKDLLEFYHPATLQQICALRTYLLDREHSGRLDGLDRWIRMVAVNRLTGHSPGFFSVYTLPPNQAVSIDSQRKINRQRQQVPPPRDVRRLILAKSKRLLADRDSFGTQTKGREGALLVTGPAARTPAIPLDIVDLVVTSPPFLDVVNYAGDNWLRCWFCGIDPATVHLTMARRLEEWYAAMQEVFVELRRVLRPGGFVAFEVGEVRGGRIRLEETVVPAAASVGLDPVLVMINAQQFTKTANCWGVTNNAKGTNTNRIVILRKPM
jgi:hypothetical protein